MGNELRDAKRQEHGAALTEWGAKAYGRESGALISRPTAPSGGTIGRSMENTHGEQQIILFQQTLGTIALLREELRASREVATELARAAEAATIEREAARDKAMADREEANDKAKTIRREEKIKLRQERAVKQETEALLLKDMMARDKEEERRASEERKSNEDARHNKERMEDLERQEGFHRAAAQQRREAIAADRAEVLRVVEDRKANEEARHDKERKEDLEREAEINRVAERQRAEFQAEKIRQKEGHEVEAAARHREIIERAVAETERVRKADAVTAALMAVILSNQEEATKAREQATRQSEALEALLMRERAQPTTATNETAAATMALAASSSSRTTRPKKPVGAETDQN